MPLGDLVARQNDTLSIVSLKFWNQFFSQGFVCVGIASLWGHPYLDAPDTT